MRRLKQVLDSPGQDRGAALILVLIVVTVIGLSGAALLTFSDTSIRTTVALRDQAGNAYNADGAAQVAIESLSTGSGFASPGLFDNATNTTCFGPNASSGTLNLPDFYPAVSGRDGNVPSSASVVCAADPATGVNATDVPITGANRPGQAIMTLGRSSEDGINVKALSSEPFSVHGSIKSNSSINVASGSLQSSAAVTAFGLCSGSIVSTPAQTCSTNTNLVDPNYSSEATAVPAYQAVPADVLASCPGGVVTFSPGYYDDASKLTALMSGKGPCGGSTWWFKPGTYYFDFHNNTNDTDVYRGSATAGSSTADQWGIKRGNLVAGTPIDSTGNVIASPGSSPTFPGSCRSPIESTTNQGVQFIFGGDSQLALEGSANAEICGTYSATRPPIGVFGLKSGTATTTTLTGPGTGAGSSLKMSAAVTPGLFTNPTRVIQQDNSSATWAKTTTAPQASAITVTGYAPPSGSAIPPGSIVKSATVRVRHGNSIGYTTTGPPSSRDSLALTFTPTGGTAIPLTPTLNAGVGLVTDSIDIYGGGTSAFARFVHDNGFTGGSMAYAATLKHPGIESLDAIQIDISYVVPAFRSQNIKMGPDPIINTNCITQTYPSNGSCAVLSTSALSSFKGAFYVQATTYAPIAAIDLTLNSATQQVLRLGAISRSLWIKETGSFSYDGPVIETPDDTPGGNGSPVVYLTVFICPATTTSTCSTDAGAAKALRVKAKVSGTARPGQMSILSWSNQR